MWLSIKQMEFGNKEFNCNPNPWGTTNKSDTIYHYCFTLTETIAFQLFFTIWIYFYYYYTCEIEYLSNNHPDLLAFCKPVTRVD